MRNKSIPEKKQGGKIQCSRRKPVQQNSRSYSSVSQQITIGFIIGQIICNDTGKPVSFILLEANRAMRDLFDIPLRVKITENVAKRLFPDTDGQWINIFGQAALTGEPRQYEIYHSLIGKYLKISVFSPLSGQFAALIEDITDRKHLEKALVAVSDLVKVCSTNTSLADILNLSLESALDIATAEWGSIYLIDTTSGRLNLMTHKGLGARFIEAVSHYGKGSRYARIVVAGVPVYSLYDKQYLGMDNETLREGIKSGAAIPVLYRNKAIACLNVGFRKNIEIPTDIRIILEIVASVIGGQIARIRGTEQLRESEEKYKRLVSEANDGMGIVQDDLFKFVNSAFENISGYKAAEVVGMPFRRLLTQPYKDLVEKRYYARLSGQELPNIYEVQVQCKDDTIKDVELSASLIDFRGRPATMTIVRDITERKTLEKKVLESERKFRDMAEMSPDWIWETDKRARFSYVNPAANKLLGYSVQEMLGRHPSAFMSEEYVIKSMDFISKLGPDYQAFYAAEADMKAKDGYMVVVETRAIPLYDSRNRFKGYLGISRDITQRKNMERLRTIFLSHVSHELRTPLATLKGFASTMLASDVTWNEGQRRDFLQTMDQEIDRLIRYINELMDLSQLEMGVFRLNRQPCRIEDIICEIKNELATLTRNHELELIIHAGIPAFSADCLRIGQVICNLTDNAAKYSPMGSPITISALSSDNSLVVSVADEGFGVLPESQAMLFEYLFREKTAATMEKRGMGLGLPICKGIVEQHGGKIWHENQPGKGSKFSFSIPLSSAGHPP